MITNKVEDFLKTVDASNNGMSSITCPGCGSQMGLRQSGSYQIILTKKSRDIINSSLNIYSRFLDKIDLDLERINTFGVKPSEEKSGEYPYKREEKDRPYLKSGGVFEGTEGYRNLKDFINEYFDYFEFTENLKNFPRIDNSDDSKKVRATLINGGEARSLLGPLIDLIFEQRFVVEWMNKYSAPKAMDALLNEVCPSYQKYLEKLREPKSVTPQSPINPRELEGIKRVQFILAILLGHKSFKSENLEILKELNIEPQVPFLLPRITEVSPKSLFNLLRSDVILNNPEFGWTQSVVKSIREERSNRTSEDSTNEEVRPTDRDLEDLIAKFNPEIKNFIHFACTGPLNSENSENSEETSNNANKNTICLWYPKEEETHAVIFIGSPGTSKSTVMLTGLTAFYEYAAGMGAKILLESPSDDENMKDLRQKYFAGKLPKPNKKGYSQTIKFSLEFPLQSSKSKRMNFVFTDIAGQTISRCLTENGADSSVKRILKNAETIVAFFDLSIESAFREAFTQGDNENIWIKVKANYDRVKETRREDADISQIQLLNRLLADLQEEKGNLLNQTKFLCVIPKADLFVQEGDERFFLTPFFETMRDKKMFVRSRQNQSQDGFDGYYSIGGIKSDASKKEGLERQQEIGSFISKEAKKYLENIGKSLGDEEDFAPLAESLRLKIKTNLFDNLDEIFSPENVYYLPVSAQGKEVQLNEVQPNADDSDNTVTLKHPPNQKLSEYVFILPIAWSAQVSPPEPPQTNLRTTPRTTIY